MATDALAANFSACIRDGDEAVMEHAAYLQLLGYAKPRCTAGDLWRHLTEALPEAGARHQHLWRAPLATVLAQGPLARRILRAVEPACDPDRVRVVYREFCDCLDAGRMFVP